MRARLTASLAMALSVWVSAARAADDTPCGTSHPWVGVLLEDNFPRELRSFVDLLRAELGSRKIDLCVLPHQGLTPPMATVELTPKEAAVGVSVQVNDELTSKRVSRNVALDAVPADGQPLMVALAVDELLHASWVELAMRSSPPPARPVPPAVHDLVESAMLPAPADARLRLGVLLEAEHYSAGANLFGADVSLAVRLLSRLALEAQFGIRAGLSTSAADGQIGTSAISGAVSADITVTPPTSSWGIDGVAEFGLTRVSFSATPAASAIATSQAAVTPLAAAGPRVWIRAARALRLGASLLAVLPLRRVYAADGGVDVTGVAGVGFAAGLGAWSMF
jgi:hypothetical protein